MEIGSRARQRRRITGCWSTGIWLSDCNGGCAWRFHIRCVWRARDLRFVLNRVRVAFNSKATRLSPAGLSTGIPSPFYTHENSHAEAEKKSRRPAAYHIPAGLRDRVRVLLEASGGDPHSLCYPHRFRVGRQLLDRDNLTQSARRLLSRNAPVLAVSGGASEKSIATASRLLSLNFEL
jgi:hypothetical protein